MEHPISDASLERFAYGTAAKEEGRAILAHLLRGCSLCSRKLHALAGMAALPPDPEPVGAAALRLDVPRRRATMH